MVKICPAVPEIWSRTDTHRQTHRQTDRNTRLPYRGGATTQHRPDVVVIMAVDEFIAGGSVAVNIVSAVLGGKQANKDKRVDKYDHNKHTGTILLVKDQIGHKDRQTMKS